MTIHRIAPSGLNGHYFFFYKMPLRWSGKIWYYLNSTKISSALEEHQENKPITLLARGSGLVSACSEALPQALKINITAPPDLPILPAR